MLLPKSAVAAAAAVSAAAAAAAQLVVWGCGVQALGARGRSCSSQLLSGSFACVIKNKFIYLKI